MAKKNVTLESEYTDGGYGWIVVISAFFIGFITDGLVYSFGIFLIELLEQFNQSRASTAVIAAVFTGVMHLVGPVAGALSDQYGCRVTVVVGAVISCTGFVISVFSTGVFYLCLSYGLLGGVGFGLMYLPATVCVIQHFNKRRALANGIAVCGSGVGMFVFNQLTRIMIDYYGWRGTLFMEAGIALHGAVFGLFLLRPKMRRNTTESHQHLTDSTITTHITKTSDETPTEMQGLEHGYNCTEKSYFETDRQSHITNNSVEINNTHTKQIAMRLKSMLQVMFSIELLKDVRCWLFLVSAFVFELAFTIPFNLIPDQAIESGMTKYEATWLSSSIGITNTISRVCIGWIADRKFVNRMVLMEILLLLAGVSSAASFMLATFQLKLIYTCVCGFLIGGYVTLCSVVLADLFGSEMIAKSFGLLMFFIGISGFLSTPIGGLLYDMTGNYDVTFVVAGAEFVVAGLLLVVVKLLSNKQTIQ